MSSNRVVISVRNLTKRYTIPLADDKVNTLAEAAVARLRHPFRRMPTETFQALDDLSLDIRQGSVAGIIGRNGAGKSTLLKILSRITEPTSGEVDIYGRVGSLLEVGTGFHPELTGRENVYLNGAILGMRKAEIDRQFDAIVEFAEIERFLDTPVKRYSSGMYVRLAFAVAAHLNPEILIVDEVLAVGDAQFQEKCLGKMQEVSQGQGRTVLFVSHNMASITQLCDTALWLDKGRAVEYGPAAAVVGNYMRRGAPCRTGEQLWDKQDAPGNSFFRMYAVRLLGANDEPAAVIDMTRPCAVEFDYDVLRPLRQLRVFFNLIGPGGQVVFNACDVDATPGSVLERSPGRYRSRGIIWANLLKPGDYELTVGAVDHGAQYLCTIERVLRFHVSAVGALFAGDWHLRPGVITPRLEWKVSRLGQADGAISDAAAAGASRA